MRKWWKNLIQHGFLGDEPYHEEGLNISDEMLTAEYEDALEDEEPRNRSAKNVVVIDEYSRPATSKAVPKSGQGRSAITRNGHLSRTSSSRTQAHKIARCEFAMPGFIHLENLNLEGNMLQGPEVFHAMSSLPRYF